MVDFAVEPLYQPLPAASVGTGFTATYVLASVRVTEASAAGVYHVPSEVSYHLPFAWGMYVEDGVGRYPSVPTNLNFVPSVTVWSTLQPLNMLYISYVPTLEVSKLDRFRFVSAAQVLNISCIFVTLEVFQPDRSKPVRL